MTDQPTEPERSPEEPSDQETASPEPPSFEQRMDDLGRRAEEAGERIGQEAEAAAERWQRDPAVAAAGDTAARVWGLVVLGVGLWFFADITLGMAMPAVAWRDVWPLALIVLGLAVVLRGVARRRI